MEELTYDKLRALAGQLTDEELGQWRPIDAVKMLLELDKHVDQGYRIEISSTPVAKDFVPTAENEGDLDWLPLGEHHALGLKWLRNYHKVGKLLHAPKANEETATPLGKQLRLLSDVIDELAKAIGSSIKTMVWSGGTTLTCDGCGRRIVVNAEALRQGLAVRCPNDDCRLEYAEIKAPTDARIWNSCPHRT